ncbi:cadherin repeat domain-containing protein, partial [Vibrio sp. RE86]|uniref:cadherin repeat domain-containing protein n=1 Tax=Vibrio sp. RE86 TaxID=2607605 RepID=UPI0014935DF6
GTIDTSASQGGTNGQYEVTVTATDGEGTPATDTFIITVGNPGPDFINETSGQDDDTYVIDEMFENRAAGVVAEVAVSDEDSSLTYSLDDDFGGLFTINETTGAISTTRVIDDAELGDYTLSVTVSDGEGGTDTATVELTFSNVNDDPTRDSEESDKNYDDGQSVNFSVANNFSDEDAGTVLTFSAEGLPAGLTMSEDGT